MIVAVDPGSESSGWVLYEPGGTPRVVLSRADEPNASVLSMLRALRASGGADLFAVETFQPRGQPLYSQLVTTAIWTGRFIEAWGGADFVCVPREQAKRVLLGTTKGSDGNVRAALIDMHGGVAVAVGSKKAPGVLYGVKSHAWAALAVAVAAAGVQTAEPLRLVGGVA